jgi:phage-related protein
MFKAIFYTTKSGQSYVEDFLMEQDIKTRAKIARSISELETLGFQLHRPKAAKIEDGIYEMRVEFSPNNFRILYYFCIKNKIVLLSAFKKKRNDLDRNDIETAKARRNDFNNRIQKGEIIL